MGSRKRCGPIKSICRIKSKNAQENLYLLTNHHLSSNHAKWVLTEYKTNIQKSVTVAIVPSRYNFYINNLKFNLRILEIANDR